MSESTSYTPPYYKPPKYLSISRHSREHFARTYYGNTVFTFEDTQPELYRWLSSLPQSHTQLLREIRCIDQIRLVDSELVEVSKDVCKTWRKRFIPGTGVDKTWRVAFAGMLRKEAHRLLEKKGFKMNESVIRIVFRVIDGERGTLMIVD